MPWTMSTRNLFGAGRRLPRVTMKTLYDVLGVRPSADPETIKQAFRRAVKAYHPDVSGDAAAARRIRGIIAANEILRDPEQRAAYDRQLALQRELARSELRSDILRAAAAVVALSLVLIGAGEIWIALTAAPAGKGRWLWPDPAEVATTASPQPDLPGDGSSDVPSATGVRSEPNPASHVAAREVANDGAGAEAGIDSSMLRDTFAALPLAPPVSSFRERAIDWAQRDDVDRAIAELDQAIRLAPNDARAYRRRGNFWGRKGETDRALADYEQAIRIDPNDIATFRERGVMWQRNGELDKALADLDHAVRMSFADPEAYSDRGAVWLEKGRYDRALADFNRALKINPRFATAYVRRAAALDRKGDQDRARADLEQATHLDGGTLPADRMDGESDAVRDR
jgi:tetratricopeptide (TPR) repeat protein